MLGMMIDRKGAENLLMRPSCSGKLTVDENGDCSMKEFGRIFFVIPFQINWKGTLGKDRIDWTTSLCRLGWKRFGKLFNKPSVAEKLRKVPWVLRLPKEDYPLWAGSGDVVVMDRPGIGSLVFCRDECLKA
jgi:hypothetical protein